MPHISFQAVPENRILIGYTHPFSMKSLLTTPISIGGFEVFSPDLCFWACKLAQHNFFHEASKLLSDPKYRVEVNSAEAFSKSVFEKHKASLRPVWVMNRSEVLHAILWEFAKGTNEFSSFLSFATQSFTEDHEFLSLTNGEEKLFSCGFSLKQCVKLSSSGFDISISSPGNNIYGRSIKQLIIDRINDNTATPILSASNLLQFSNELPDVSYRKTVALISDDTLQCSYRPEGGDLFIQPGVSCSEIVDYIEALHVDLRSYHVLIFCLGAYDADQLDAAEQALALLALYRHLKPAISDPGVVIIFNTPIGSIQQSEVPTYSEWFLRILHERITSDFGSLQNVYFCDWSNPAPDNPFINEDRSAQIYFMLDDGKFPNANGLRRMMRQWVGLYHLLGNVQIRFGEKWPYGSLLDDSQLQVVENCQGIHG